MFCKLRSAYEGSSGDSERKNPTFDDFDEELAVFQVFNTGCTHVHVHLISVQFCWYILHLHVHV